MKIAVVGCGAVGKLLWRQALPRRAGRSFPAPLGLRRRAAERRDRPQRRWRFSCPARMRPDAGRNRRLRRGPDRAEDHRQRPVPETAPAARWPAHGRRHAAKWPGQRGTIGPPVPAEQILGGLCFVCLNRIAPGVIHHMAHGTIVLGNFSARRSRARTNWPRVSATPACRAKSPTTWRGALGKTGLEHSLQRPRRRRRRRLRNPDRLPAANSPPATPSARF